MNHLSVDSVAPEAFPRVNRTSPNPAPTTSRSAKEKAFSADFSGRVSVIVALPPPPDPAFDIEKMERIEVPPHTIWRDDFEEFGPDWWTISESEW